MAIAALNHVTHYPYDRPGRARAADHPSQARPALPRGDPELLARRYAGTALRELAAGPEPATGWRAIVFPEPVSEFRIEVDLVAELSIINPFDFFVETYAESFPSSIRAELQAELAPYLVTEAGRAAAPSLPGQTLPRKPRTP